MYVKYPVQNSWRYESIVLTNRIAGKRMNIKKIKLFRCGVCYHWQNDKTEINFNAPMHLMFLRCNDSISISCISKHSGLLSMC